MQVYRQWGQWRHFSQLLGSIISMGPYSVIKFTGTKPDLYEIHNLSINQTLRLPKLTSCLQIEKRNCDDTESPKTVGNFSWLIRNSREYSMRH